MPVNATKILTATAYGITSYGQNNKHMYQPYQSKYVQDIQSMGRSKYQVLDRPAFNRIQKELYAKTLYGLKVYSEKELIELSHKKKSLITKNAQRVKFFLNKWKQEIVDTQTNIMLQKLFPKSSIIKYICSISGYNRAYMDRHTFKQLGLTETMVATKLVEGGFLPNNFFQLA
jgi:hypothetical protein